jgi:hypothetical protein
MENLIAMYIVLDVVCEISYKKANEMNIFEKPLLK